jgi:rhomboid protease GluP
VHNRKVFFRTMGSNLLIIIGINLAIGFVIPNIDNAGHIGGLVGGFLAALIVQLPKQKQLLLRLTGTAVTIIFLIGLTRYGFVQAEEQYLQYTALQGQELLQAEKYEEAYTYLNEAIKTGNSSNDSLFLLSVAEIELRKYDQAMQHLKQIISDDESYHRAHFYLGILYANTGETALALEEVNKALEYDPTNEDYKAFKDQINR